MVCRDHHDITQCGIFKAMFPVQLGTLGTKSTDVKEVMVREFGTNINFQSRHQKNLSEVAYDASGGGSYIGASSTEES